MRKATLRKYFLLILVNTSSQIPATLFEITRYTIVISSGRFNQPCKKAYTRIWVVGNRTNTGNIKIITNRATFFSL